jgi:hypothetical protein
MKVEMAALRPFRPRAADGMHHTRLDASRRAAERGPTRRSATSPTSLARFDALALPDLLHHDFPWIISWIA